jgi:glycosyltransferase involved in cell wall biosynthesis
MVDNKQMFTLGVCIPVWNRGDLFLKSFNSLISQLEGVSATIFIYDNGSDSETVKIIQEVESCDHLIIKTFLPKNMGIPYVANLFAMAIQENCDYAGYISPQYTLIMDADAYFKKPVRDLLRLFNMFFDIGLLSGHDSIEHKEIYRTTTEINGASVVIKVKENERMLTMFMRKEEFTACYPFPHYRDRDVDWELTQWNLNSMKRRSRSIYVACDYVLHLGLDRSTWQSDLALKYHTESEINEVKSILSSNNS